MGDNAQQISQLQMMLAQGNNPSFNGMQAGPDPQAIKSLMYQLQQKDQLQQANQPTPGPYGYLHDAGNAGANSIGQQLGNALGASLGANPLGQGATPPQKGPAFTPAPPGPPNADGSPAAPGAPIPTPGATQFQDQQNKVKAAAAYYQQLVGSGMPADVATVQTLTQAVKWGNMPGDVAGELAKAQQQVMANQEKKAKTDHENAQAATDLQNETVNRPRERDQEDTRLKIEQQNADTQAGRAKIEAQAAQAKNNVDTDSVAAEAAKVASGLAAPPSGAYLKTPRGQAVQAIIMANPDYDSSKYVQRAKAITSFAPNGNDGKAMTAFNVAMNHSDVLLKAADGLGNGDVQAINAVKNVLGQNFGNAGPTTVKLAAHLYSGEVQKTIINNGGTEADRDKVEAAFKDVNSPEQFKAAIATANKMLVGKVQVSRQNYDQQVAQGKPGKDEFENRFLSPTAKRLVASDPEYQAQFNPQPTSTAAPTSGWGQIQKH